VHRSTTLARLFSWLDGEQQQVWGKACKHWGEMDASDGEKARCVLRKVARHVAGTLGAMLHLI
jgi:hypothetical protein